MIKTMNRIAVATLLAGAALAGCKKEEPVPTIPAKTDSTPAMNTPKPRTDAATLPAVTLPTSLPTVTLPTSLPTSLSGALPGGVGTAVAGAGDPSKMAGAADAQSKLDEVSKLMADKKYDLADSALKKLEQNKASLPEMVQSKLPSLRTALDAAMLSNSASKLPSIPKGSGIPDLNK